MALSKNILYVIYEILKEFSLEEKHGQVFSLERSNWKHCGVETGDRGQKAGRWDELKYRMLC